MKNTTLLLVALTVPLAVSCVTAATPAETAILRAQEKVAKQPSASGAYNDLAMAYARRARETSDVQFYGKAEETLKKSFSLAPANYEGLKTQAWLLLGRHEFAKARELATTLNRQTPDDVTVYGYLADANAELGNYDEAVAAVQWMLNIRPGNVPGLTRAAYLRELHGDPDGAIELMQQAYDSTPFHELEDRAWLLTQVAHLYAASSSDADAERFAKGALDLFPDYHYALGVLGHVRMHQKRYADAAELFQKRCTAAPHAENLFDLAVALDLDARHAEAAKVFGDFERKAVTESETADNANHELVAYYVDHAHNPEKALRIAEQELARRHDAYTLDAYAWSLAATGDYGHAASEMHRALSFGLKDPRVIAHAEAIKQHTAGAAE